MLEITYDEDSFNEYTQKHYVYKNSQYAFTFDDRFLIYYYKRCDRYVYIALDTTTDLGSEFDSTTVKYKKSEYETLIPKILNSIKYTGELKYLTAVNLTQKKQEQETEE